MELLKGKKGIITGALNDKSIAWKVAERAIAEGAEMDEIREVTDEAEYKNAALAGKPV